MEKKISIAVTKTLKYFLKDFIWNEERRFEGLGGWKKAVKNYDIPLIRCWTYQSKQQKLFEIIHYLVRINSHALNEFWKKIQHKKKSKLKTLKLHQSKYINVLEHELCSVNTFWASQIHFWYKTKA